MWLIGSTPSNPAAFSALNFSSTLAFMPRVGNIMAFFNARFFGAGSAADKLPRDKAAAPTVQLTPAMNVRRDNERFIALDEFSGSRHRDGRNFDWRVPSRVFRAQAFLRIHRFVPGNG